MAANTNTAVAPLRPTLAQPRRSDRVLEAVRVAGGGFDPDLWHVMDERDNALVAEEVLHGALSKKFVYSFNLQGTNVSGVSVVGARHLAAHYGGIKHRIIATVRKDGALHTFTSYPNDGAPMAVSCKVIPELEPESDYFQTVIEVTDIKSGNSIQVEKSEKRFERKRDGGEFERPHYAIIAQSKAYRNAVLSLVPQDVVEKFKQLCIARGQNADMTESAIEEKRGNVLRFAAAKGIALDRTAIAALSWDQISGLSDAAKEGGLPAFARSCEAAGLIAAGAVTEGGEPPAKIEDKTPPANGKGKGKGAAKTETAKADAPKAEPARADPPHDPDTGEIREDKPAQRGRAAPAGDDDNLFG